MGLVDQGGRYQSTRTEYDFLELFQKELMSLPEEERVIALELFQEQILQGESPAITVAAEDLYRTPPVPMEVFLSDPYFLGSTAHSLFPALKVDLAEMFSGGYQTAILGGSLGAGKTTEGVVAILRMLYETSCLKDPHEAFGVSKTDYLLFPCISATEDVAEREILSRIRAVIDESTFFMEDFKPLRNTAGKGIEFPNKLLVPPGISTESGALGGNPIGAFIDESNFFQGKAGGAGGSRAQKLNIEIIYEGIKRRIKQRFMMRGRLPGIIVISSSKTSTDSFTDKLIRKSSDDPSIFVRERSAYEVRDQKQYSGDKFRVAIGNETKMSRILGKDEPDPEGMNVIDVPEEFRKDFEDDLDKSIRDISGYSTVAVSPFISRREKIYEAIDKRSHPFNMEIWEQDFPGKIEWSKLSRARNDGAMEPILNPKAPRHIHLDLSKNRDTTGFLVSHISSYVQVQRLGKDQVEMAPEITLDFALKIKAPTNGDIIYSEIRRLIYEFSRHGFFIKLVTADQFQSVAVLQTLSSQGYNTKQISVDRPGPYEILKTAFYENRVKMYNYPPLIKELRELQKNWKTGKVDHPDQGSKDCSDSLAGTVATLTESGYGISDQPIRSQSADPVERDEEWVLEAGGLMVDSGSDDESMPEWRRNAEKVLEEKNKQSYDWNKNFQLPFITG